MHLKIDELPRGWQSGERTSLTPPFIAPPWRSEARSGPNASPGTRGGSPAPKASQRATRYAAVAGSAAPVTGTGTPHLEHTPDRLRAVVVAVAGAGAGAGAGAVLDTTAQLPEGPQPDAATTLLESPQPDAATTLRKRAKAKARTEAVVEGLAGLGTETPLRRSYARTLLCANILRQADGKVEGKYCGNRWCVVCNRIRTAKLRTAYAPELATWADAQFITLTIPNVQGKQLHSVVRELVKTVRLLADSIRRTDRLSWKAVRKLEVTYSTARRDYHPHLHLLVAGKAQADVIVRRWLATFLEANPAAQKVVPCAGPTAMAELFKYLTKQTVKDADGKTTAPPARVLDTIYKAVRKLRTIQPMGFTVAAAADVVQDEEGTIELDESTPAPLARTAPVEWQWLTTLTDWVDFSTGEVLSGYEPTAEEASTLRRIRAAASPPDDPGREMPPKMPPKMLQKMQ